MGKPIASGVIFNHTVYLCMAWVVVVTLIAAVWSTV
jgi:hypothetical protein